MGEVLAACQRCLALAETCQESHRQHRQSYASELLGAGEMAADEHSWKVNKVGGMENMPLFDLDYLQFNAFFREFSGILCQRELLCIKTDLSQKQKVVNLPNANTFRPTKA